MLVSPPLFTHTYTHTTIHLPLQRQMHHSSPAIIFLEFKQLLISVKIAAL